MLGFDRFTQIRIISGPSAGLAQKWRFFDSWDGLLLLWRKTVFLVALAQVSSLFNCLTTV